jgi:hypothetical protein
MVGEGRLCIACSLATLNTTVCRNAATRRDAFHLVWRGGSCWHLLFSVSFTKRGLQVWLWSFTIPVRPLRFGSSHLTARPTATGEKRLTLVDHHPRPRVGANVSRRQDATRVTRSAIFHAWVLSSVSACCYRLRLWVPCVRARVGYGRLVAGAPLDRYWQYRPRSTQCHVHLSVCSAPGKNYGAPACTLGWWCIRAGVNWDSRVIARANEGFWFVACCGPIRGTTSA